MTAQTTRPILHLLKGREGELRAMRFWSKVAIADPDQCWDWTASVNRKGYGRFKVASHIVVTAHRMALILHTRDEPPGLCALHRCDRPVCCNPHHLRWGTVRDNSDDKIKRGRARNASFKGFDNPSRKLSPEQLVIIVSMLLGRKCNTEIAEHVPVSHAMISRIRLGKSWAKEAAELGWVIAPPYELQRCPAPALTKAKGDFRHGC